MKTKKAFFLVPYLAWIILFVILPILLILWYSFTDSSHSFTLSNYVTFFKNGTFLKMMINSFWYAFLITLITLPIYRENAPAVFLTVLAVLIVSFPAMSELAVLDHQFVFW